MVIKSTVPVGYTAKIREWFSVGRDCVCAVGASAPYSRGLLLAGASRQTIPDAAQNVGINPDLQNTADRVGRVSTRQDSVGINPDLQNIARPSLRAQRGNPANKTIHAAEALSPQSSVLIPERSGRSFCCGHRTAYSLRVQH